MNQGGCFRSDLVLTDAKVLLPALLVAKNGLYDLKTKYACVFTRKFKNFTSPHLLLPSALALLPSILDCWLLPKYVWFECLQWKQWNTFSSLKKLMPSILFALSLFSLLANGAQNQSGRQGHFGPPPKSDPWSPLKLQGVPELPACFHRWQVGDQNRLDGSKVTPRGVAQNADAAQIVVVEVDHVVNVLCVRSRERERCSNSSAVDTRCLQWSSKLKYAVQSVGNSFLSLVKVSFLNIVPHFLIFQLSAINCLKFCSFVHASSFTLCSPVTRDSAWPSLHRLLLCFGLSRN